MVDKLKKEKSKSIEVFDERLDILISDKSYAEYLRIENGGYYFDNSLHFFGISKEKYHSINLINKIIKDLYGPMTDELTFIGEDIFGNLFCFNSEGIYYHFNIESGEIENMGANFNGFLNRLYDELDFYTGKNLVFYLNIDQINSLSNGFRYSPKLPFVLGGKYEKNNLQLKEYKENLEFSFSIYIQIKDLPDGTEYCINIK